MTQQPVMDGEARSQKSSSLRIQTPCLSAQVSVLCCNFPQQISHMGSQKHQRWREIADPCWSVQQRREQGADRLVSIGQYLQLARRCCILWLWTLLKRLA